MELFVRFTFFILSDVIINESDLHQYKFHGETLCAQSLP